jgi:carbohydrate kinase (thermoresistant glucokinase family)
MPPHEQAPLTLLMGVSGSGKTAVGRPLAARLGLVFLDADDLHPPANVAKMRAGTPLTDADRDPWLQAVAAELERATTATRGIIIACSALKRAYRDRLRAAAPSLRVIHLTARSDVIRRRLDARTGHFMPATLLDSQFATLEPPGPDERPIVVDVTPPVDAVVDEIVAALGVGQ